MKLTLESWLGIMILILMFAIGIGFTSININVVNARKIYSEYIDLIEETDGAVLTSQISIGNSDIQKVSGRDAWIIAYNCGDDIKFNFKNDNSWEVDTTGNNIRKEQKPVHYYLLVTKTTDTESNRQGQTFIYNNIYKVQMVYVYDTMLFGRQTYKIGGLSV